MTCFCGAGQPYTSCCQPYHVGETKAPTALALMRSRYSAYAQGLVHYLIQTTHPQSPLYLLDRIQWIEELHHYCQETRFLKLEVLCQKEQKERASVHFIAHLQQKETVFVLEERSYFQKVGDSWLYKDGDIL